MVSGDLYLMGIHRVTYRRCFPSSGCKHLFNVVEVQQQQANIDPEGIDADDDEPGLHDYLRDNAHETTQSSPPRDSPSKSSSRVDDIDSWLEPSLEREDDLGRNTTTPPLPPPPSDWALFKRIKVDVVLLNTQTHEPSPVDNTPAVSSPADNTPNEPSSAYDTPNEPSNLKSLVGDMPDEALSRHPSPPRPYDHPSFVM